WVQSAGTLKRVSIGGGPARDVTKAFDLRGASWAPDGSLVFAPDKQGGLMRLPPGGGTPTPLTTPDKTKGEESHVWPQVLPDGTAALFTVEIAGKPFDEARIECVELATGRRHVVLDGGTGARYASGGYILFGRHNTLHAARFDRRTLQVTGAARPILEGVRIMVGEGTLQADAAADRLVYLPRSPGTGDNALVWVDRQGHETILAGAR